MDALVAEVVEHNPELKFYQAEIAAAKGQRQAASTWANPELSVDLGGKQVKAAGLSSEGLAWSSSVRQPIEWLGRLPLRKAIANRQLALAELGLSQFKATIAGRTRAAVYRRFAAQEKAKAARAVAQRFEALREVMVQRDAAGLTPQLETRIIEATELTLQRRASEATLEADAALLELNQLLGRSWKQEMEIEAPNVRLPALPGTDALLVAALTNNFELKMRQAELEQQGFRVSLAKNDRYPTVSVGPYYSQERAGDREQQFGIGVTIPLPLWNRNSGNIAAAEARRQQAETSLFVTQRSVERKVMEQEMRYRGKLSELAKWRADSVQQFREAAELADRHYRLGAVPISTYTELQKQYLDAVEALLDSRKEALEAVLELEQIIGVGLEGTESTAAPNQKEQP